MSTCLNLFLQQKNTNVLITYLLRLFQTHPSIAATRLFGLAQGILLQNLKGFDELKKMSRFSK